MWEQSALGEVCPERSLGHRKDPDEDEQERRYGETNDLTHLCICAFMQREEIRERERGVIYYARRLRWMRTAGENVDILIRSSVKVWNFVLS